jgi:hypothetical protein
MYNRDMKAEEFFTPQKRFSDTIDSTQMFILDRDIDVFGKALRAGAVLHVIAWREIEGLAYLVISKGTWESLILFEEVKHLLKK